MTNIEWTQNIIYAPDGLTAGEDRFDGWYWVRSGSPGSPTVSNNLLYNVIKYNGPATGEPDAGSIIADPQFIDPANGDYSLLDDSPAYIFGFVDLGQYPNGWNRSGSIRSDKIALLFNR